jgi:hypothetical protein
MRPNSSALAQERHLAAVSAARSKPSSFLMPGEGLDVVDRVSYSGRSPAGTSAEPGPNSRIRSP